MAPVGCASLSPDQARIRLIRIRQTLESFYFRALRPDAYYVTSCRSDTPNCIAWAAGDLVNWWEPSGDPKHYWPHGAPLEYSVQAYIKAFESCGYAQCSDAVLEPGFEKVAIYLDSQTAVPSHAARQLPSGAWTSKLGRLEDIEHHDLAGLSGPQPAYGSCGVFLKRLIS